VAADRDRTAGRQEQSLPSPSSLDDDPKQPRFIETLPRRGYRFVGKLAAPVPDDAPAATVPEHRLVGRDGAFAELWDCIRSASTGKPQVVFITGEAGIGKTALAEEFRRRVTGTRPRCRLAHGQCVEGFGSKEPFYPVLQAVGQLCRSTVGATSSKRSPRMHPHGWCRSRRS
jgi:hypothetical protein